MAGVVCVRVSQGKLCYLVTLERFELELERFELEGSHNIELFGGMFFFFFDPTTPTTLPPM